MRKLIFSLFLASTAAMPALAQDQANGRRDRGNQSAQSDDGERTRPARVRAERQSPASEPVRERRAERVRVQRDDSPAATAEAPQRQRLVRPADTDVQRTQVRRERPADSIAGRLIQMRRAQQDGTTGIRRDRPTLPDRDGIRRDRDGDQTRRHRDSDRRWTSHWRSDNRYDWRRHRDRNRSTFHFGHYYDPYGYNYRRFSIGFSLWPSYYRQSYWLNDPWQYRLPPAYGPYRWVRYYDDALLVDIYSGEVVDVIRDFFW